MNKFLQITIASCLMMAVQAMNEQPAQVAVLVFTPERLGARRELLLPNIREEHHQTKKCRRSKNPVDQITAGYFFAAAILGYDSLDHSVSSSGNEGVITSSSGIKRPVECHQTCGLAQSQRKKKVSDALSTSSASKIIPVLIYRPYFIHFR